MLRVSTLALALVAIGWIACDETTAEEQTCIDVVDALSDAWEACGYDRESKRFELLLGFRNCEDVDQIRDDTVLRSECFPALATLDCTSLETDALPDSCLDQVLF